MSSDDGMTEIATGEDLYDSRDIIARIEYLESRRDDEDQTDPLDEDEGEELDKLLALQHEAEPYSEDWKYGSTLISDDYFEEYAEEFAYDIGAISREADWPISHIDWKAAADELKQDYTEVDFDGNSYWVR